MESENVVYDPAEDAVLYAAGVLPPDQAAEVEARLAENDALLAEELGLYQCVLAALAEDATPITPRPGIKQALIESNAFEAVSDHMDRMGRSDEDRSGEVFIRRAGLGGWKQTPIPGLEVCVLHRDSDRNLQTSLLRAQPGFRFPAHKHAVAEECYVLEGDFHTYGTVLTAGDYVRAPAGSSHGSCTTEKGCLLLFTSEIKPDSRPRRPRKG